MAVHSVTHAPVVHNATPPKPPVQHADNKPVQTVKPAETHTGHKVNIKA